MMWWLWGKGFSCCASGLLLFFANQLPVLAFRTSTVARIRNLPPQIATAGHRPTVQQSRDATIGSSPTDRSNSNIVSGKRSRIWSVDPLSASSSKSNNDQNTSLLLSQESNNKNSKNDAFWSQQQALADELQRSAVKSLKQEQMEIFKQKRLALVYDTAYVSALIFATCWCLATDPFMALSYVPGAILGLAYSYGLGKSVEKIGASPIDLIENNDTEAGSGVGDARFAFLILLFLLLGKFQSQGLQPLPAIAGFFTYQLASLKQGLQEMD